MDIAALTNHRSTVTGTCPLFCLHFAGMVFRRQKTKLPVSARYYTKEVLCNFSLAAMHQGADILAGLLIAKLYLAVFGWKLFDIQMGSVSFVLLMIAQDFAITGSIVQVIECGGCGRPMWCTIVRRI